MASLKGKTIFITGGSRGIGKAIVLRAAAGAGAKVAFIYRQDQGAALRECSGRGPSEPLPKQVEAMGGFRPVMVSTVHP